MIIKIIYSCRGRKAGGRKTCRVRPLGHCWPLGEKSGVPLRRRTPKPCAHVYVHTTHTHTHTHPMHTHLPLCLSPSFLLPAPKVKGEATWAGPAAFRGPGLWVLSACHWGRPPGSSWDASSRRGAGSGSLGHDLPFSHFSPLSVDAILKQALGHL